MLEFPAMSRSRSLKTAAVGLLDMSGIAWLLKPFFGGRGMILCLHRVLPPGTASLKPALVVSTTQLESILQFFRDKRWDIVPLGEIPDRLRAPQAGRHFVSITLDDGYVDNPRYGTPLFGKYEAPYTIFAVSGVLDRTVQPWWVLLDPFVLAQKEIELEHPSKGLLHFSTETYEKKLAAFAQLLRLGWQDPGWLKTAMRDCCARIGKPIESLVDEIYLSWDQLRDVAKDKFATIGSHTVTHPRLSTLPAERVAAEMSGSRERLSSELGHAIEDIAYPFGSPTECGPREFALAREAGYLRGVTTERWNVFPRHQYELLALPRVTVSQAYAPNVRFVRVSAYGAWNRIVAFRG